MAMGLLFVLFCTGLIFLILGIHNACLYREQMQDATDGAALTAASAYANVMNDARNASAEQWQYIRLAYLYASMTNVPFIVHDPAGGPDRTIVLSFGPCAAAEGAPSPCDGPKGSIQKALNAATAAGTAFRAKRNNFDSLMGTSKKPIDAATDAVAAFAGQPSIVKLAAVKLLGSPPPKNSGPTTFPILKCATKIGDFDTPTVLKDILLNDVSWNGDSIDRPGGKSGGPRTLAYQQVYDFVIANPYYEAVWDDSLIGTAGKANASALKNAIGYLDAVIKGNTGSVCLPLFTREARAYRVTAFGASIPTATRFADDASRVFVGALKRGGGVIDASEYAGNELSEMADAGQYSLSQAAFGLNNRHVHFLASSTAKGSLRNALRANGAQALPGAKAVWSTVPLHLLGDWGAALVRVNLEWNDEDARNAIGACPGCVAAGDWVGEMLPAMMH